MEEKYLHRPVLLREAIDYLNLAQGKVIIDATIGGGGHAEEILPKIIPTGFLIGIDRDSESLEIASRKLERFQGSFKLVNKNFRYIKDILKDLGVKEADGILFDLGISTIQMESAGRGFSIKNNGPLDMRMDKSQSLSAKGLINSLREEELSDLIRDFGEERFHRRIARKIIEERRKRRISTTQELAEIISSCNPAKNKHYKIHPATRTFQALRIRVNDELSSIEEALREAPYVLKRGGRVCVISFHSLEDRIAKNILREYKTKGIFNILTKKPIVPKEDEVLVNPRSRSAKLRVGEKL